MTGAPEPEFGLARTETGQVGELGNFGSIAVPSPCCARNSVFQKWPSFFLIVLFHLTLLDFN
jgi:hypothetical protein